MTQIKRLSFLSIITILGSLFITIKGLAVPSLPSSFYGSVKVNIGNVSDGTLIQAIIGGQVYAEGYTQTYQGESVYSLDVKGDDTDTAAQDGGREGDVIQFKIGGVLADQTGVWHTGTNFLLNLTTTSIEPVATPEATPTPYPTQTAIVIFQPTLMPTNTSQASLTPTSEVQPSLVAAQPVQPSPAATMQTQPVQTPIPSENEMEYGTDNGTDNNATITISIIVLMIAIGLSYYFYAFRKKKL